MSKGASERDADASRLNIEPTNGLGSAPAMRASRILVIDADAALFGLLGEWLRACGCTLLQAQDLDAEDRFDLILMDVPFPRQAGAQIVKRVAGAHPGTPIVILSSSFFAAVEPSGAVARGLGVDAVLPKPLRREALLGVVGKCSRSRQ